LKEKPGLVLPCSNVTLKIGVKKLKGLLVVNTSGAERQFEGEARTGPALLKLYLGDRG
jgi:hypothetical protein